MMRRPPGIPEGVDPDFAITSPVYCAQCGHNLLYQSFVGLCNECGTPYNARPFTMKNIFTPQSIRFPFSDIFLGLICSGIGLAYLRIGLVPPRSMQPLVFGGSAGLIGLVYLALAAHRLARYIHSLRILRRVRSDYE